MSNKRLYAERDIEQLDTDGNYYCNHIQALTSENLLGKSEIAAELAYRDRSIARLREALRGTLSHLRHASDTTDLEVCYSWCPICVVKAALEGVEP